MEMTAANIYGTAPVFISGAPAQTALSATDNTPAGWKGLLSPKNPLFWFGAVLLTTVGAAGLAGSVKLGPARLAASVGKS
jgi:hypothetical protein